ncbi:MFS transporter [Nitratireductor mangrovi]|uniref:MFS transporter n=1 Tax=Nitratireductor mangrovi TaxID=2599600 RepID=A0A5B8L5T2_9HYPH|nr:MFS transporter [Nitratireductor mangrovi]QDZ03113.1 MFS transporter [Nitratireductor mangrovi]
MTSEIAATTANSSLPPARAGMREWVGLAVIALPCLLYSMDLTVLNLAVPHLAADLKPTSAELLWIVDIYGFLVAGSLITMGTLGDRIGRRKLLLIGAAAFGVASVLAAFSTTPTMLIVARALLGIAAATLAPSTLSLIRNMFRDPAQRTFAIGVWIASFSAGGALGPLVGGVVLTWFWWGAVFLINVPIMLLLLALGPFLLPEFRDPDAGRLDLASAALSLVAVLAMIFGIKHAAVEGFDATATLTIAVGLALGLGFVVRQRRLADPLIDLGLFRSLAFTASLATNVFAFFIAFGTFLLTAQYLQLVIGLSPLAAGLWSAPSGLAFIVGSMTAPAIVARVRPAYVLAGGLLVSSAGFLMLAAVDPANGPLPVAIAYCILSLGLAPVFTLTTDIIISAAPPERAGSAAALAETSSELGGALGIAVLGSIITAAYRGSVAETLPGGLTPEHAAGASDTLAEALQIAEGLPAAIGEALAVAARTAFAQGFEVTALISVAIAATGAIVAASVLRRLRIGGEAG